MKIKTKLTLLLLVSAVLAMGILTTYLVQRFMRIQEADQYKQTLAQAEKKSEELKGYLDVKLEKLHSLGDLLNQVHDYSDSAKITLVTRYLRTLSHEAGVSNAFVALERGSFFPASETPVGTYYTMGVANMGGQFVDLSFKDYKIPDDADWFHLVKKTGKSQFVGPFKLQYTEKDSTHQLLAVSVPLSFDGHFAGVIGMAFEMASLQKEVLSKMKEGNNYVILVSNEGLRAGHPKPAQWFVPIGNDMAPDAQAALQADIKVGKVHRVIKKAVATGQLSLITYAPMTVEGSDRPFSLGWVTNLSELQAPSKETTRNAIIMAIVVLVIWVAIFYLILSHEFSPFTKVTKELEDIASGEGDLTQRLPDKRKDEAGDLGRAFNLLMNKLQLAIGSAKQNAGTLAEATETLSGVSRGLLQNTKVVEENIHRIGSAAEESSVNATEVASSAEQMSANMHTIAAAVEEMNATISEIADNANSVQGVANQASTETSKATETMGKLGEAAKTIGAVTEAIKRIADKTNLLALNATIEAASAGEAGKGFAVVANEIKDLANQSATSAGDIARRIEAIQTDTSSAVAVIAGVVRTIHEINDGVSNIRESIGQQKTATQEIASNVAEASTGASRVANSIGELAKGTNDTVKNVAEASRIVEDLTHSIESITENNSQSSATIAALANMAEDLRKVMDGFRV